MLHEAGVPRDALQLLPGAGEVGAALVADPRVQGVVFTGSTPVARLIEKRARRSADPRRRASPLIAETGGLNAMVVDSSALAEQVVADVIVLGLRLGRPALLGAAHPLPAGRRRRAHARRC